MITRNRVIVVCTPFTVVSRSSVMSEIITFMFDPAKLQMNWARASGAISRRADADGRLVGAPRRQCSQPRLTHLTDQRRRTNSTSTFAACSRSPVRSSASAASASCAVNSDTPSPSSR
jgi:hypothetical protein